MLSFALGNVDLAKGKHAGVLAKSLVASAKKTDARLWTLSQAISRTRHLQGSESVTFKSQSLEPMLAALAPLMDQDTSTLDFDDPEFLASLNCKEAFFETARLLMIENNALEPDGLLDSSNFHWAGVLTSTWALELLLAYNPAYMNVFSDWKELSQLVQPGMIPPHFAVATQAYCALMSMETWKFYGLELTGRTPLLFFQLPFYLSLGNLTGATRIAIKLLEILKGWDLVLEILPTVKVVYPLFLLCCFFLDHGDLNRGMEAYRMISSFADRYQAAQSALLQLDAKLALLYPAALASSNLSLSLSQPSRKRGLVFLEEAEQITPLETQLSVRSSPEAFLASLIAPEVAPEEPLDFVGEEVACTFLAATWSSESNELSSLSPQNGVFWPVLKRDPKEDERPGLVAHFELDFTS